MYWFISWESFCILCKDNKMDTKWLEMIKEKCSECIINKELDVIYEDTFHLKIEAWKSNCNRFRSKVLYVRVKCDAAYKESMIDHPFDSIEDVRIRYVAVF
jgi:hypothetical protein